MKKGLFILVTILATSSWSQAWEQMYTETGNYCVDQGMNYIRNTLGPGTKIISRFNDRARERHDLNWFTWFKTNKCDGLIAVTYGSTFWWQCKSVHYISVPHYAWQAWATGDCKRLMPDFYYNISKEEAQRHL